MNAAQDLLRVSARAVAGRALLLPLATALALVGSAPFVGDGYAVQVLRGTAVLLACAATATMDDPAGEVLAAAPRPRVVRSAYRLAAGLLLLAPAWALALAVVGTTAGGSLPGAALTVEAAALTALGVGLAAGLRAWRDSTTPSLIAIPCVLAGALALNEAPRGWALLVTQTWGPPWEAAQIRWASLLLLGVAVVAAAWRDPLDRRSDGGPAVEPGAGHDHADLLVEPERAGAGVGAQL